jgi:hypothetical protein
MRLVGVAMVRNEADIIEAFVRHNLAIVDAIAVVDHGSVDGTFEILHALAAECVALTIESDATLEQRQPEVLTRLARAEFARGADIVFPLDADEFLKVPDRPLLERVLSSCPAGTNAALHWQTYVPDLGAFVPTQPLIAARRRLGVERHGVHKVVLTSAFNAVHAAMLGPGSHTVLSRGLEHGGTPLPLALLSSEVAALAHLPVRTAEQITRKVTVGWLAHSAARRDYPDLAFHWRELCQSIQRAGQPTSSELATIAANYGVPRAHWKPVTDIALVDDPLPPGVPLRYSALGHPDAGARVLAFAARFAKTV